MFLKRIILHGFKSFADRTEFEFGSGVTAIVGPNGCGKSNVLDAVRWVLGEQSPRNLRGGKMADVIFAGSRSRPPAPFAEVQLIFDNRGGLLHCDAEEVIVGRVLYRAGVSEYRLNGNACRLKEIRELLLDTGVGVDAYSVIEQGRVDLLLQSNPVERREIFEEAAGISRYKFRRAEAQRRLERTDANLQRLQDVLEELERRLRSVRLAAGKARSFQQYDAQLRSLRSTFSLAEFHELEQQRQRAQAAADDLTARLAQRRAELAARDAETAEIEEARQRLDEEIQAAEAALLDVQTTLGALAERIDQVEKRLPELAALGERRQRQAADAAARLAAQQERLAQEAEALEALRAREGETATLVAQLQQERQAVESQAAAARQALEAEKRAAFEAVRQAALLQNEQENRRQQLARLSAQTQRLDERQAELTREHAAAEAALATQTAAWQQLDARLGELTAALRDDEALWRTSVNEAEQLDQAIGVAKEQRSALLSRLSVLEDLERRLEGVDQGTRAVLAWRADERGRQLVAGLVADLLRIDDPRVALLQPVLATFENHLVVRDTAAFLAERHERGVSDGALRVLALDRLGRGSPPLGYGHTAGVVARAADWVTCAAEFRPLAEHVLGRVFIVDSLDLALRLAAEALAGCVFVTLAGEVVGADGRLTFGATVAATGLISRRSEIRQLGAERDEVEGRLVQLTRRRLELDATMSDLQLRKDGRLSQIAGLQREHADVRHQQTAAAATAERLQKEARLVREELAALSRAREELAQQLESLRRAGQDAGEAQQAHEERVANLAADLAQHEAAVARLVHRHTDAQVECGRATEKRSAAEQALAELEARAAAIVAEQRAAEDEAAETRRQREAALAELQSARQQQAELQAAWQGRQAALLARREARQQERQRLEACGAAGRAIQHQIEELEAELHACQMELRESAVRAENLVARVREELGLDLTELYRTYEHAEQDWEAVRAEIEDLRGKIARLGHVNLDALAELEELTPRYEHLTSQREDLTAARRRLEALIAELDERSRTRFAAAFDEIRGHFQEMFRKLFGGGKADVVLEDPERPLECGIEIIARPPGKEPQSLSLLSGGEKTMTAVALLLAVFRSRPSPFAFLDEVDAALDEANIERFNSVLQEFLSHSQFVVITHSKRTMAVADVLYGVTMEEPGVSKRVSVRFEDRVRTPSVA